MFLGRGDSRARERTRIMCLLMPWRNRTPSSLVFLPCHVTVFPHLLLLGWLRLDSKKEKLILLLQTLYLNYRGSLRITRTVLNKGQCRKSSFLFNLLKICLRNILLHYFNIIISTSCAKCRSSWNIVNINVWNIV